MSAADSRIDAYIAKAQPFAQPILSHLREVLHRACPGLTESIKWSRPAFEHEGRVLAVLGAFKAHAALTLWKAGQPAPADRDGMGQFGKLTSVADLPDEAELVRIIQDAAEARVAGVARPKSAPRPELPVPEALAVALVEAPAAQAVWAGFSASQRRDYCEWVGEAKRAETRDSRVAQSVTWIAEGKVRNWKYQR